MTRKKPRGERRPAKVAFKRRDTEFAGLKRELHPKTRWEYLDMDYIESLSAEEKTILSKFIDEYYGASLSPADDDTKWKDDFHSTSELRKDCMDRNNARNRDIYTILRTRGMVDTSPEQMDNGLDEVAEFKGDEFVGFHSKHEDNQNTQEDVIIEMLDSSAETNISLENQGDLAPSPLPKSRQE